MKSPIIRGQYQTANNPIFEAFYIGNVHVSQHKVFYNVVSAECPVKAE